MATVQHPIFSDVTHEVPEGDVSKWTRSGWKRKGGAKTKTASNDAPKATTTPASDTPKKK